ncbi:MAG: 23S rRNA (uracil(1939)-C(5))-methyltransferase RlmD [Gammaproteobacteria bacterium]
MSARRSRKQRLPETPVAATVESLSHDGRGVARVEGKTVFIDGALAGEEVRFRYRSRRRSFDEGEVEQVLRPSPLRVTPKCPHFGVCGGCSLQHMAGERQIEFKQQILLDNLQRLGGVSPEEVLPPLRGPRWRYRRRARLSVKYVRKKGRVLVGFRERHSPYVAELQQCDVLHPAVGLRIESLRELIGGLHAYDRIAQIEVAVADNAAALVFRNLDELQAADIERLRQFGRDQELHIYLQPGGPDSVFALYPSDSELSYRVAGAEVELQFRPTDFVQINAAVNDAMVTRALDLLQLGGSERVLDLFCGIGNFSLPMARRATQVVGVEGDRELVDRATGNARRNGLANVEFHVANLAEDAARHAWAREQFQRVLLDPPRAGALEVLPQVAATAPDRIVYVSCHPGTLARDAGQLVQRHGYRLACAGVMDMFPHTAHVESIALFVRR